MKPTKPTLTDEQRQARIGVMLDNMKRFPSSQLVTKDGITIVGQNIDRPGQFFSIGELKHQRGLLSHSLKNALRGPIQRIRDSLGDIIDPTAPSLSFYTHWNESKTVELKGFPLFVKDGSHILQMDIQIHPTSNLMDVAFQNRIFAHLELDGNENPITSVTILGWDGGRGEYVELPELTAKANEGQFQLEGLLHWSNPKVLEKAHLSKFEWGTMSEHIGRHRIAVMEYLNYFHGLKANADESYAPFKNGVAGIERAEAVAG